MRTVSRAIANCFCLTLVSIMISAAEPGLSVGVCNQANVSHDILISALSMAHRIFEDGGIKSEWIDLKQQPDLAVMLYLRILAGKSRNPDSPEAFGNAFVSKSGVRPTLADIYYGQVAEMAWTNTNTAKLLANVMAHEIGHLLGLQHAKGGVMRGPWREIEFLMAMSEGLRFSTSEVEKIEAVIEKRTDVLRESGH
jgi:hypothetical protein